MNRNLILRIILLVSMLPPLYGQSKEINEISISGSYQGKNLYIQNPLKSDKSCFCTNQVFVNEVLIFEKPQTSAFEINLSNLNLGESVNIKIIHDFTCMPRIINPQAIRDKNQFQFLSITADEKSIRWYTQGEEYQGEFIVEKSLGDSWSPIVQQDAKGRREHNQYEIEPDYAVGRNEFRIKYLPVDGNPYYSKIFSYSFYQQYLSIKTIIEPDKIILSQVANYEVLDSAGNTLFKGKGLEIGLNELDKGLYYLNVEDKVEKFYVK